jgi:hypothetical protein
MTIIETCFPPRIQAVKQHFTGTGVEVDPSPAFPAQVGRTYRKTLFRQHLCRHSAVLGAYRWPVRATRGGEDVGTAEQLYLEFVPAGTQRVKLSREVTDTEVHIAMPLSILGAGRPRSRAFG